MPFQEHINIAATNFDAAKEHISGKVDEVKGKISDKVEPLKDKLNEASVKYRGAKAATKEVAGQLKDVASRGLDKVAALRVNIPEAKQDLEFLKFLSKTGTEVDWDKDQATVREKYVVYKRTSKISENIGSLFEGKLKDITGNNPELRTQISDHLTELARTNPESLRRLERQADAVVNSEKLIAQKQAEIDKHLKGLDKQSYQDKVDTLEKASSVSRVLAQTLRLDKFGVGKDKMLAVENAQKQYGLKDSAAIRKELKAMKLGLKTINNLEDAKTQIKSRFAQERADVFLDNDTAKFIHEKLVTVIEEKVQEMQESGKLSDLKKLRNMNREIKTQFSDEGRVEQTGLAKKFIKDDEYRDVPFIGTATELDEVDSDLDEQLSERVAQRFERLVNKTEPNDLEEQVTKHFQRIEFAGYSKKESAQRVFETFTKILNAMPSGDEKAVQLKWVLNKLEHLTA